MRQKQFPGTFQFLGSYFHQDFDTEFPEPEAAVEKFIKDSDAATRAVVVSELQLITKSYPERELDQLIFELGCYYSPQRHRGITMSQWLSSVINQIQSSLES